VLIDVAAWRQDILDEHLEELESLWNRRLAMPRAATLDAVGLQRCDARIEAHGDALVLTSIAPIHVGRHITATRPKHVFG